MATTNINIRVDAVSHDGIAFEIKRVTPNVKTRTALTEYNEMKKNLGSYKRYGSFDELIDEVFDDA